MLRGHSGDSITERAVEAYSQIEDPRLREVMAALIRHLHALVKEVRLEEQEWEFAWDFMARMARFTGTERNEFLLLGGRPRISPTPALDLFFPTLIDRSPCV